MKRFWLGALLLLLSAFPARAQLANAQGWCEAGAQPVVTSGLPSTTLVQASFPQCTVQVNIHGGGTATIFSTGSSAPLANPFQAQTNGRWIFYASSGEYDIVLSGAGFPTSVTYSDVFIGTSGGGGGGITPASYFIGPEPWASAIANGATCNGLFDDSLSLNATWTLVGATGNEMRVEDNCNWVTPSLATPSFWSTLHVRGRLNIGATLALPPLTDLYCGMNQRGGNSSFSLEPMGQIVYSSSSISPLISMNFASPSSIRYCQSSNGGGFTGIGLQLTSTPAVTLDTVNFTSFSNTSQPLVVLGSFGLRISHSQFAPGNGSATNPCVNLEDNASNGDTIRDSWLSDLFCNGQGLRWGSSGSFAFGSPSAGLFIDRFLFENSTGANYRDAINVDSSNNAKNDLYARDVYVADSSSCTINFLNATSSVGSAEIIFPNEGGCARSTGGSATTGRFANLFLHTTANASTFFNSSRFTGAWQGLVLAGGATQLGSSIIFRSGQNQGNWNDSAPQLQWLCPNDTITGTTSGRLVRLTTAGNCINGTIADTNDGIVGVLAANATGESGSGTSGFGGVISNGFPFVCVGDSTNPPTAGNYVKGSSTANAAQCTDTGVSSIGNPPPTTGHIIGISSGVNQNGQGQSWIIAPILGFFGAAQTNVANNWTQKQTFSGGFGGVQGCPAVDLTAQAININATTFCAATFVAAGFYRFSCYTVITQAATTSGTMPNCLVAFTDNDTGTVTTSIITQFNSSNTLGSIGAGGGGTAPLSSYAYVKASTNIQYSTTGYASSGATPLQYALHLRLEFIGP